MFAACGLRLFASAPSAKSFVRPSLPKKRWLTPMQALREKIDIVLETSVQNLFPSLASELPRVPIEPLKHSLRGDFVCTIAHRAFPQVSQQSVDEKPASVVELAKTISEQAGRLANADPELSRRLEFHAENGYINMRILDAEWAKQFRASREQREIACPISQSQQFTLQSIGVFESCFLEKHGTPRQGSKCPTTRGKLELQSDLSPHLLDGIAAFSHVWLIFVFHANSENGSESHQKAKVHAPRLMGDSTGVLASRSPHRVNPVGLTVCRLDRIENRTLYLSGVDLIEGTPVLDVKPYHPADVIPSDVLVAPTWVTSPSSLSVSFSDAAEQQLSEIVSHRPLVHYKADDLAAIRQAIADVLSLDPRSVHSRSAHSDGIYNLAFDRLNVVFRMRTQDSCQVWKIEYCPPDVHRVRTVPAIRNILLN